MMTCPVDLPLKGGKDLDHPVLQSAQDPSGAQPGGGLWHGSSLIPPVEFSQGTTRGRDLGQAIPEPRGEVGFGLTLDSLGGGRVLELIDVFAALSLLCLRVPRRHGEMLRPLSLLKCGETKEGGRGRARLTAAWPSCWLGLEREVEM